MCAKDVDPFVLRGGHRRRKLSFFTAAPPTVVRARSGQSYAFSLLENYTFLMFRIKARKPNCYAGTKE
jgi:hypothetical protein